MKPLEQYPTDNEDSEGLLVHLLGRLVVCDQVDPPGRRVSEGQPASPLGDVALDVFAVLTESSVPVPPMTSRCSPAFVSTLGVVRSCKIDISATKLCAVDYYKSLALTV